MLVFVAILVVALVALRVFMVPAPAEVEVLSPPERTPDWADEFAKRQHASLIAAIAKRQHERCVLGGAALYQQRAEKLVAHCVRHGLALPEA